MWAIFNTFLSKSKTIDKTCFLVGDLNINLIDYQSDAKVRDFVNLIFQYSLVPIVNKPTRFTKNNATLIDYIITNSFTDQENLNGSDHFPIFTISMKHRLDSSDKKSNNKRERVINADSIQEFRYFFWSGLRELVFNIQPRRWLQIFLESFLRYIPSCIPSQNYLG